MYSLIGLEQDIIGGINDGEETNLVDLSGGGEVNYSFLLWFPETSWGIEGVSQKVFFSLNGVSGGSIDSRHIFDNAYEMPVNEWHYISVTVNNDSKYAKLYINGVLFSERNLLDKIFQLMTIHYN